MGFEVLLSPETNKEIVEMGVKVADPETCFSNKVYWSHLLWLDGKSDLIFVPRLKASQEKLGEKIFFEKIKSQKKKIVLISHPYNLYDQYVN